MKIYYSKRNKSLHGYEDDGSQDFLIGPDMIKIISDRPSLFHAPVIEDDAHTGEWILNEAEQRAALIPESVTKRQARQELFLAGVLDAVQPAIDGIPDPVQRQLIQIYWDESAEYELNHPELQAMAQAIGFTQTQLEDMFISASQR